MKYRVRFEKWGVMQYVGHLDMMRFFQKAIRRARLPIKYSEGFNPHPVMSFAQPLGIGVTSGGEYMDIELTEAVNSFDAVSRLNAQMVDGVRVCSFRRLSDHAKNAMASVAAASYRLTYADSAAAPSVEILRLAVSEHLRRPQQIPVERQTKKGTRQMDLKPLLYEIAVQDGENGPEITLCVSAGSADSVKPQLVMQVIHDALGMDPPPRMHIHRIDLYAESGDGRVSLDQVGKDDGEDAENGIDECVRFC